AAGAGHEDIEGVEVVIRPALTAGAADVLAADGYLLGTPANIGYMSGALKHFFDGIYYPCRDAPTSMPAGNWAPRSRRSSPRGTQRGTPRDRHGHAEPGAARRLRDRAG